MRVLNRPGIAALLLVTSMAAPTAVAADTGGGGGSTGFGTIEIAIGRAATLTARLVVSVPITITCTPPPDTLFVEDGYRVVHLSQAAGRSVTTGDGFGLFVCDGLPHDSVATVVASTIPFHGGTAVASAEAGVCGILWDGTQACSYVVTPITTVRIGG